MPKTHELKILPLYFHHVRTGLKTFEIRKNDRDYQAGDNLLLREWDGSRYTNRSLFARIVYMTNYAQQDDYVVMGIELVEKESEKV